MSYLKRILAAASLVAVGCSQNQNESNNQFQSLESDTKLFQEKNITSFDLQGSKKIVLTFDDGPRAGVTDKVLDVLKKYNAQGTFFVLGRDSSTPEGAKILSRMKQEGHIVANHTWNHPNLAKLKNNPSELLKQLVKTHDFLSAYQNPKHRLYFRAPFGAWSKAHAAELNRISRMSPYIGPVFWDIGGSLVPQSDITQDNIVSAADWDCWAKRLTPEVCAIGYMRETIRKNGGIMLLHDITPQTLELLKILIPKLQKKGFQFVSLDEVIALDKYEDQLLLKK